MKTKKDILECVELLKAAQKKKLPQNAKRGIGIAMGVLLWTVDDDDDPRNIIKAVLDNMR